MLHQDYEYRGHPIQDRYVGEGITFFVVVAHTDGLVGGRGCNGSLAAAHAEVDRCLSLKEMSDCQIREDFVRMAERQYEDEMAEAAYIALQDRTRS